MKHLVAALLSLSIAGLAHAADAVAPQRGST